MWVWVYWWWILQGEAVEVCFIDGGGIICLDDGGVLTGVFGSRVLSLSENNKNITVNQRLLVSVSM